MIFAVELLIVKPYFLFISHLVVRPWTVSDIEYFLNFLNFLNIFDGAIRSNSFTVDFMYFGVVLFSFCFAGVEELSVPVMEDVMFVTDHGDFEIIVLLMEFWGLL